MRNKTIILLALVGTVLSYVHTKAYAQTNTSTEYIIDTITESHQNEFAQAGKTLSIDYPKYIYSNENITKEDLKRIIAEDKPERVIELYSYYTINYGANTNAQHQKIRVPFYNFMNVGCSYELDTIAKTGNSFLFKFEIPAQRGHNYEVSLNWNAGKINYVRYTGQATAGSCILCNGYVGRSIGTLIKLNHFDPKGDCYEMYFGYDGSNLIGRGIDNANKQTLIIADEQFHTLKRFDLRYKIREIVSGKGFQIIFDDAKLKGTNTEIPAKEVMKNRRYLR